MPILSIASIKEKLSKVNENVYSLDEAKPPVFYDSGSYALNLLLSGSIFGGYSDKISVYAANPSTGKTFLMLYCIKCFLDLNEDNQAVIFDTEDGITESMISSVGLDRNRVVIVPITTVQEFRTQCLSIIDIFVESKKEGSSGKLILGLDSIGMLSTTKEVDDSKDGKETQDMTRAKLLKSTFRVITLRLSLHNIPLIALNHVYETQELFSKTQMSGGKGAEYSASTIVYLSKSKDKDGNEIVGNIITATAKKSRLSRENSKVQLKLSYKGGLSRYYGLVDLGIECGLLSKSGAWIVLPDGSKAYEKTIYKNPEKYFTSEFLQLLDEKIKPYYSYTLNEEEETDED